MTLVSVILDFVCERPALVGLIALTVLVHYVVAQRRQSRFGKPLPMPRGLPVLGNILQMGRMPWYQMTEWAHELGEESYDLASVRHS